LYKNSIHASPSLKCLSLPPFSPPEDLLLAKDLGGEGRGDAGGKRV